MLLLVSLALIGFVLYLCYVHWHLMHQLKRWQNISKESQAFVELNQQVGEMRHVVGHMIKNMHLMNDQVRHLQHQTDDAHAFMTQQMHPALLQTDAETDSLSDDDTMTMVYLPEEMFQTFESLNEAVAQDKHFPSRGKPEDN